MRIRLKNSGDFKQDLKDLKFWPLLVVRFLEIMKIMKIFGVCG